MKRFLILSLLLLLGLWGRAQPTIIAVDTTTGVPMQALPFHRPFFLKIPARNAKPLKVYLFEHIRHKTLAETLNQKTIQITSNQNPDGSVRADTTITTFYPQKLDDSYFFAKKEGDKLYTYINFRDEYALRPSRQYSVAVYYGATPGVREVFNILHQADKLGNGATDTTIRRKRAKIIRQAVDKYNEIALAASLQETVFFGMSPLDYPDTTVVQTMSISSLKPNGVVDPNFAWNQPMPGGTIGLTSQPFTVGEVVKLTDYYEKSVRLPFQAIDKQIAQLDSAINAQASVAVFTPIAALSGNIFALYKSIDGLKVNKTRDAFAQDDNRLLRVAQQLKQLNASIFKKIAGGMQPLLCNFCKPAKAAEFSERLKNIDETLGDVRRLGLIIQVYETQFASFSSLLGALTTLQTQLEVDRIFLKALVEADEVAVKAIGKSEQFTTADLTSANTFIFSFETRTKLSLVPEVGLVTNRIFKGGSGSDFLLMPFIGATVNFSQLDRDVPFYLIRNKTFWTRTGLVLGMTLVSLKDSTANPPRDNFFEKSSLITGLSFRFSNTVKAVTGYNWYYNRAPDTGRRTLAHMPFIGLSFDLDVQKYVQGLFGAVTSLKGPIDKKTTTATP